jgi:diketogulonate reductase-like aldo/keto reductase
VRIDIPVKRLNNGFALPVYGLGLWQMGGRREADYSRDELEVHAIRRALDAGITHIDTAELYGVGHAEELLGLAMRGFDRSKLTIASKVLPEHQTYDGILRACESSLKRIGTDYLDLYMLHQYPPPGQPIAETMKAMDYLVDKGIVRHIGVSNLTVNRFIEAQSHASHKIVCNQLHYNVLVREAEEKGLLAYCQKNDIFLVAWRPLQKGEILDTPILHELAKKYHKTPGQIAINWLISQKNVVTISKTSSVEHLHENLGAIGWNLRDEDIERVRSEFPDQLFVSGAVPLDYPADIPAS